MVEGYHSTASVVLSQITAAILPECIPPFPHSCRTCFHLIEPGWTGICKKHFVCILQIAIVCQGKKYIRRSGKSGFYVIVIITDQFYQICCCPLFIFFKKHIILQRQNKSGLKIAAFYMAIFIHQNIPISLSRFQAQFPVSLFILFFSQNPCDFRKYCR